MFEKTTSRAFPLARTFSVLAALTIVAGCGEAPSPEMDEPFPDDPAAGPPGAPMNDMVHATTPLLPVDDSGVSGEAMAMHADDAVVVSIDVQGLPEEGEYPAHIHQGTCEDGGPVAAPLNPVIGTADGMGTSTATLELDEVPADEPSFVQVHGPDGAPIACGDIEGHGD